MAKPGVEDRSRRVFSILGTAAFLVLAPGTVAGFVPWWISHWRVHAPFPGFTLLRVIDTVLIVAGIPVLLECFARFALQGIGTPAPVFPTRRLVIKGSYRFVRGIQCTCPFSPCFSVRPLFLGSIGVAVYTALAWLVAHLFVIGYEEPTLLKSYGAEYETYRAHVPRWIPKFSPWRQNAQ